MKFDSNRAWKEASAAISGNREVLLALAGVFFVLPSLAFALLVPAPQAQPAATAEQSVALMQAHYAATMPYLLPMMIVQATGTLALLALFTDRRRPTVAEAIKLGALGLLPYVAAQLLLGVAVGLGFGLLGALAALTGIKALVAIVAVLAIVGIVYAMIKTSLTAPVIMVDRTRNPVAALRRSWSLTSGNSLRIGLFYLLLFIVFFIVVTLVMAVTGLVSTLLAGGEAAKVISAVVSSVMGAVMTLYFVAVIAAVHRQLAGPSAERVSATFE